MSAEGVKASPPGFLWHLRYALEGQIGGAPRTVDLWSDGVTTRAVEPGGACWVWAPTHTVVRTADGQVRQLEEGRGDVYVPPFPEARAVESVQQVCSWLDTAVDLGRAHTDRVLGRPVTVFQGDTLTLAVDQESGYVLRVAHTGIRGAMTLTALEFNLVPAAVDLLTCEAQ